MPGIAEFLAEGSNKLIVAELPDGSVMLTVANTITHERHSITMRAHRGARRQPVPSTGSDPSRSFSFAFGTALPAPLRALISASRPTCGGVLRRA
jgi:hypothetical protein